MRHCVRVLALMFAAGMIIPAMKTAAAPYRLQQKVDFIRDIQPIFQASCYPCHGTGKVQTRLRLVDRSLAMSVIVAGNSRESRLMHRILGLGGEPRMPMGAQPLKPEQIDLIRKWIDEGADWPESAAAEATVLKDQSTITQHWAFIAPRCPSLPPVQNNAWAKNPIDRFLLARIEQQGLTPSPEAAAGLDLALLRLRSC